MKLKLIFDFIGTLFPIIFPKNEFKPKRAVFVLVVMFLMMFAIDHFGFVLVDQAITFTGDAVSLTEEAK